MQLRNNPIEVVILIEPDAAMQAAVSRAVREATTNDGVLIALYGIVCTAVGIGLGFWQAGGFERVVK